MNRIINGAKRLVGKISRREGLKDLVSCMYYEVKLGVYNPLVLKSWSPDKEDLIIDKILGNKKDGFFVDVGAHEPFLGNNTQRFHKKGWNGINIEPDINRYNLFLKHRAEDINLNIGIADEKSTMTFYVMFPESLSTFSKSMMEKSVKEGFKFVEERKVKVNTLSNLLNEHSIQEIDFMNIDTEGFDLKVLKGNDWDKFKPKVICIEEREAKDWEQIDNFLKNLGYKKLKSTYNNCIFSLENI